MKRVTIGIPSYNEERNIINLLRSLKVQYSNDYFISEIIISDDSTDSTPELVEMFAKKNSHLNINLIHHCERRGAAAGWNEIFSRSTGDVIVLYDADIVINKDTTALAGHLHSLHTGLGQLEIGVCHNIPSWVEPFQSVRRLQRK
jgi:glycosyltransferase involved in cell wall biosynthesis